MYSPVAFGKKWDPEGDFVRKYIPELKHYDKKYIYEPSKAPIVDQKKWGCQISGDGIEKGSKDMAKYPKPMFDFNERRQFCLDKMKAAYDNKLYGDNEKVMSGEWKKIFGHKEGRTTKDEALGEIKTSRKRTRTPEELEEEEYDNGEKADVGDADVDERDTQPKKQRKTKVADGKSEVKQTRLDGMVERSRRKT